LIEEIPVTESRPQRPVLATLICIFEAGVVVMGIASHFIARYLREAINSRRADGFSAARHPIPPMHYTPLHLTSMLVSYGLALAIAVTLWQMRRSAFYLLATRTVLAIAGFGVGLLRASTVAPASTHTVGINHAAIFAAVEIFSFLFVALDATMTWYVYDITKPQFEAVTTPETNDPIEGPSETLNHTQSTARFYLASEEDQRKPN
jgi:hypothetical protein